MDRLTPRRRRHSERAARVHRGRREFSQRDQALQRSEGVVSIVMCRRCTRRSCSNWTMCNERTCTARLESGRRLVEEEREADGSSGVSEAAAYTGTGVSVQVRPKEAGSEMGSWTCAAAADSRDTGWRRRRRRRLWETAGRGEGWGKRGGGREDAALRGGRRTVTRGSSASRRWRRCGCRSRTCRVNQGAGSTNAWGRRSQGPRVDAAGGPGRTVN